MVFLEDALAKTLTDEKLGKIAFELFLSEREQRRMVAVFLFGKLASKNEVVLDFMKRDVAKDENWRVQEILGMAFDHF